MAKYNIYNGARKTSSTGINTVTAFSNWDEAYKDGFVEQSHDFSELSLILPDDCLVIAGPPRITNWKDAPEHAVGYVQGLTISQTSSVQPLKGLGSRRHIFAKTNQPVSVQINRMIFTGASLLHTLYASHKTSYLKQNEHFDAGSYGANRAYNAKGNIYTNIEDDLYRVPFGLMVYLNSPAMLDTGTSGSYSLLIEACTLQSHTMAITAGESFIMEQVSLFADRVVGYKGDSNGSDDDTPDDTGGAGGTTA